MKTNEVIERGDCGGVYFWKLKRRSDGSVFLEFDLDGYVSTADSPENLGGLAEDILGYFYDSKWPKFCEWWEAKR